MLASDITVEVLDIGLTRRAQIRPQYLTDLKTVSRLRAVGAWSMSLPSDLAAAEILRQPGASILITGPDRLGLFSGPVLPSTEKADQGDPDGTTTFEGADWNILLADALAWPQPSNGDVTSQAVAYDVRNGAAETVVKGLVDANIGPSAPPNRRGVHAGQLYVQADLGRGFTVSSSSRFDNLLDQCASITKLGGVGFRNTLFPTGIRFEVFTPADLSKVIRLDLANRTLSAYEHARTPPSLTRVIVGGQGEGELRTLIERSNQDSVAAEQEWGRRIEVFKDERNTDVLTELQQAGDDLLIDGGATADTLKLTPVDDTTMRYLRDWNVGDYITAVIRDTEIPQIVTSAGLAVTKDGVALGITVGDLDPSDVRALSIARRVRTLETR